MSKSPYKRRRPSLVKNFWVYRRMVGLAVLLGLLLWFIVINNQPVVVYLPFGIGEIATRSGLAILLGVLCGSLTTALGMTIFWAVRRQKNRGEGAKESSGSSEWHEDRPPADYAAKTPQGFPDPDWPGR